MEDGHIDPTIHVPGARVGTPTTDRQSYIPHTLTHSNIYHIPYIDTYTTHRQTAIYTAYIHKHITIHSYYIQITDMHTKYRYIHIHTKDPSTTIQNTYTPHMVALTTHKLQTPH